MFNPAPGGGTSNAIDFDVVPSLIQGVITLSDFAPDPMGRFVHIELWSGEDMAGSWSGFLGTGGTFQFNSDAAPGTYTAYVSSSPHWLTKAVPNVVIGAPTTVVVNASLINGDVDGDNEVGPGDFGALSAAFGSVEGDANYNENADLDGDGEVGPSDFGILSANFGLSGNSP